MKNTIKKPFIHVFSSNWNFYLYDVNSNRVLQIPQNIYDYLDNVENQEIEYGREADDNILVYLSSLDKQGYLKSGRVEISEHPATLLLEDYLKHKLRHMSLQVTQQCNLRCEYCVYSGKYDNRMHSHKQMSFEIAKKAIDYFIAHSDESEIISIGFYGGEPLLAFNMIKQCVKYAEKAAEGRTPMYTVTTNGSLLSEDVVDFFIRYKFSIVVSLDGPENIHNKHRKFAHSNKGSFAPLMKNIQKIKEKYPEYYLESVSFNTVMDPQNSFAEVNNFMMENQLLEKSSITSTVINSQYAKDKISYSNRFHEEYYYEIFLFLLKKIKWIKSGKESKMVRSYYERLRHVEGQLTRDEREQLPVKMHHSGPCIPGVLRLFVDAEGKFFPCERVSESNGFCCLGDVNQGINPDRANKILNIERLTSLECRNCWAYCYCTVCVASAEVKSDILHKVGGSLCEGVRNSLENIFKDIVVLEELGYDFQTKLLKRGRRYEQNTDISL